MSEPLIQTDLPCISCQYNLRGLTAVHRCPECGFPALRSYLRVEAVVRLPLGDSFVSIEKALPILAAILDFPVDAVRFVTAAHRRASQAERAAAREGPVHLRAADIWKAVGTDAVRMLGGRAAAREVLSGWGITRGEDVGRIVAAMVEAGFARASETDSPADFRGLPPLDDVLADRVT